MKSPVHQTSRKKSTPHKLEILYQDQWIIVVNKPSGMLAVPYPGSRARTAQSTIEEIMRKKGEFNRHHKPLAVHRLDRDTSGVMMFALTEQAQKKIMDTWHQMVTERLYRAIAENPRDTKKFLPDEGLIDDPLAFNAYNVGYVPKQERNTNLDKRAGSEHGNSHQSGGKNSNPNKWTDNGYGNKHLDRRTGGHPKTVPARTHYRVITRWKNYTLFELSLDTGKKNQIRAHLASKGYPLAGDTNFRAKTDPFGRLALHARTLAFTHPFTGEEMKFEVPEPFKILDEWESLVDSVID